MKLTAIYMPIVLTNELNSIVSRALMTPLAIPYMREIELTADLIKNRLPITNPLKYLPHPNYWTRVRDTLVSLTTYHLVKSIGAGTLASMILSIKNGSYPKTMVVRQSDIDILLGSELSNASIETSMSMTFKNLVTKIWECVFCVDTQRLEYASCVLSLSDNILPYLDFDLSNVLLADSKGDSYFVYYLRGHDELNISSAGQ